MNNIGLKTAFRSFIRKPLLPSLNLFGLSLGIACFLVISLYLYQENTYETAFKEHDRIFRIEENFLSMGSIAWTSSNVAQRIVDFPNVEAHTRVNSYGGKVKFELDEQSFKIDKVLLSDSSFFQLFNYEFVIGDATKALTGPNQIVLSEKTALQVFGRADVVGEALSFYDQAYVVVGVAKMNKLKSHLDFNAIAYQKPRAYKPSLWFGIGGYSYVKLAQESTIEDLNSQLMAMAERDVFPVIYKSGLASDDPMTFEEWSQSANKVTFRTKPIRDIYTESELQFELGVNGDKQTRVTLTITALLILLVAAINFMNLSTARASTRVKEIGVKKVLGSDKRSLVVQLLSQYLTFVWVAALLGAGLSELFARIINLQIGEVLSVSLLTQPGLLLLVFIGVSILALIAGAYPAFYLTTTKMVPLLKGQALGQVLNMKSAASFRNGLVVIQFVISSTLIAASIIVFQQLRHLQTMEVGYDRGQVILIENAYELGKNKQAFKNELEAMPAIEAISFTDRTPGDGSNSTLSTLLNSETTLTFGQFYADEQFTEVLGLELIEGDWFDPKQQAYDSVVLVNESTAAALGFENPVGEVFGNYYKIKGVVKDFHFGNIREGISPAIMFQGDGNHKSMAIRVNTNQIGFEEITELWSAFSEEMIEIKYMDQNYAQLLEKEKQVTDAVLVFTILAIIIATLGLFGLAAFNADQRKYEFGIRRVLGASMHQLASLFSFQFLKLIALAFIISVPLSIYSLQLWLNGFSNRIDIGASVFALVAMLSVCIAICTLVFQSLKVSKTNPVDTLRNE